MKSYREWERFAEKRSLIGVLYSYNVTPEELFDLFGKFGPIRYVLNMRERCSHSHLQIIIVKSAKESPITQKAPHSSFSRMSWMQSKLVIN